MKKFIIKTFCFLLPIIIIGSSMEFLLRNIPNDYLYKKEYLDKHANDIETLILGSSHTFYGLDPKYFSSNTFNASYISQSLNYDFEIYKKYQDELNSLKTIILPISYFTLWSKLENSDESWRIKNYSLYYKIHTSSSVSDNTELFSSLKVNILRLYSYYIRNQNNISCSELGWGTTFQSDKSKDLIETGKTAAIRHTKDNINSNKNINILNENISTLCSIIELSKKRNIKVILITTPVYRTYLENLNREQKEKTSEIVNQIAEKYNCLYINLLGDTTFVKKDFYDADHLNEIGAKKLSLFFKDGMNL